MPGTYHPHPDFAFGRDLKGYGEEGLKWKLPNNAKVAVSFVINYEEGAESCVLSGDAGSETGLREKPGTAAIMNERDYNVESEYEYGSRAGFWRFFRLFEKHNMKFTLFEKHNMKFTLFAVAKAIEGQPEVGARSVERGHDIACHGYRWVDYSKFSVEQEKEYIKRATLSLKQLTGSTPKGWFIGRNGPNSRTLVPKVYEELGEELVWSSDTYADDVPYWIDLPHERNSPNPKGCLMVPYSYDCNDFKFHTPGSGFRDPAGFYDHMKNAFDVLYEEGEEGMPKMMTVGLHCRILGRPGRFAALRDFVRYIEGFEGVWVATRTEIAECFKEQFPYKKGQTS